MLFLDYSKVKSVHSISSWWGIGGIFLILFIGNLTSYTNSHLPDALRNAHLAKYPNAFIAERAYKDLKILNDFGPKPTGSYANEVLAVDFLLREISYIDQLKNKNQEIVVDKQIVSGGYVGVYMNKSATSVYRNVQNVIAKLVGKHKEQALLLNCHFDSVATSPGASDDLSGCAVMLEILRVMSRQSDINQYSIIFLFNGAEETPLQVSVKWYQLVLLLLFYSVILSQGTMLLLCRSAQIKVKRYINHIWWSRVWLGIWAHVITGFYLKSVEFLLIYWHLLVEKLRG